jgi:PKHD-type hydroxylase
MLIHIQNLLTADELTGIHEQLNEAEFVDGKVTAGATAARVKDNLQLDGKAPPAQAAGKIILAAIQRNRAFGMAVRPKAMLMPLFNRYEQGMQYGEHLDNPLMGGRVPVRSDVSVTIFLSDPDTYDGGELVLQTDAGTKTIRGNAGDAFAYPSNLFHQVTPVTRGVRIVGVTWVQSIIRDPAQRRLLYDLGQAVEHLQAEIPPNPSLALVQKCQMNLVRMWAEL